MSSPQAAPEQAGTQSGPVELVIQVRIVEHGAAEYTAWQTRVGKLLETQPGFIGQTIYPPTPPAQVDWIVVQRFASTDNARHWLQSDHLHAALGEIESLFVGKDEVYLRTDVAAQAQEVSALITCAVAPHDEAGFLNWERETFQAEAKSVGFVGHRLDRPVPGIQEHWVIVLTFDSDANLTRWLESPERAALLKSGAKYQSDLQVRKTALGFGFWFGRDGSEKPTQLVIIKSNLVVLLVLYPIVFLWGLLVGDPILGAMGMPFWLALFIGNLFSTQVTGLWAIPVAMEWLKDWLVPHPTREAEVKGWTILLVLFVLSMALYAYLMTLPKLKYF